MISINDIRQQYIDLINDNYEDNMRGAHNLKDNLERSPLYYKNRFASYTVQIPRVYTLREINQFQEIVATAYSIFDKVIREYMTHADYRAQFPFSPELEELILADSGYDCTIPIARFDIFYHEDTGKFYFCEINTDGTSAMNEDRIQDELSIDNPAHQEMSRRYNFETFELFDSWVDTFINLYKGYGKCVDSPNIAIIDFLDNTTLRELQEFVRHFQSAGYNCEICDVRELTYKGGKLYSKTGHKIDAIYRRAVTVDIMNHYAEVSALLQAVRDNAVFLAGSFKTQIVHHKILFQVLHLPRTQQFLTGEEIQFINEHVPATVPLNAHFTDKEKVKANKDDYIIKPSDDYGSSGVFAGVELSQDEWERKIDELYGGDYICQTYVEQYESPNIDFAFGDGAWHNYINMAGLYVYGGKFAGVFSRQAIAGGIIASHRNERTQPTYLVTEKD